MESKIYFVWGGVFTNTHFQELLPGAEECYGPFHHLVEAERVWSEKTRRQVDIAAHRMYVLTVGRPQGH